MAKLYPIKLKINKTGLCSTLSSNDLIEYGKLHKYNNGIPKIIHYVYRSNYIPNQYSNYVRECMELHNDVKFVFWNDLSAYRFIINNFPEYLNVYSSYFSKLSDRLKISDVIRYFILYKFGGIYMDLDTKCQKRFESVMNNTSCILSREIHEQSRILWNYKYLAMNSFMACVPIHEFFHYVIKKLPKSDNTWIIEQTGPIMLTNAFEFYNKSLSVSDSSNPLKSILLADAYLFSPESEIFLEKKCMSISFGKWRKQGCQNLVEHRRLQKVMKSKAIVIHLFMHLGYDAWQHQIKRLDYVCSSFNNFTVVWS